MLRPHHFLESRYQRGILAIGILICAYPHQPVPEVQALLPGVYVQGCIWLMDAYEEDL